MLCRSDIKIVSWLQSKHWGDRSSSHVLPFIIWISCFLRLCLTTRHHFHIACLGEIDLRRGQHPCLGGRSYWYAAFIVVLAWAAVADRLPPISLSPPAYSLHYSFVDLHLKGRFFSHNVCTFLHTLLLSFQSLLIAVTLCLCVLTYSEICCQETSRVNMIMNVYAVLSLLDSFSHRLISVLVLFSANSTRLVLKRKLSNLQWMAIVLLAVGTTASQVC